MEWTSQKKEKKNNTQTTTQNFLFPQSHLKKKSTPFIWTRTSELQARVAIRASMSERITMGKGVRVWYLGTTQFNPKITFSLQIEWRVPTEN